MDSITLRLIYSECFCFNNAREVFYYYFLITYYLTRNLIHRLNINNIVRGACLSMRYFPTWHFSLTTIFFRIRCGLNTWCTEILFVEIDPSISRRSRISFSARAYLPACRRFVLSICDVLASWKISWETKIWLNVRFYRVREGRIPYEFRVVGRRSK